MKHGVAFRKLSRTTSHRMLMLRNLVTSLIKHEQIKTTLPKARETARLAEKVITMAKQGDLPAYTRASGLLLESNLRAKLFGPLAQRYAERVGGYTRIHKFGNRPGDNAPHAVLELVDNPHDIKFEMTARAIGWDILSKRITQDGPHKLIQNGVEDVGDLIENERGLGPKDKGVFREKTRWNLQKVLKFRGDDAIEALERKVKDHIDTLLAQPLVVKNLLESKVEGEERDDTTTIVSPTSLKPKAGQAVPGGPQNTLRLAAGALYKDRRLPKWIERKKLGLDKNLTSLWNTI